MLAHNRQGKGDADANGAYTQSDSSGEAPGAKPDIFDCLVRIARFRLIQTLKSLLFTNIGALT